MQNNVISFRKIDLYLIRLTKSVWRSIHSLPQVFPRNQGLLFPHPFLTLWSCPSFSEIIDRIQCV